MDDSKFGIAAQRRDNDSQRDGVASDRQGTTRDQHDMRRMGKEQELRRNFRFVSIFGYSMVLMATWETMLTCVYLQPLLTLPDDLAAH
jgi:choline transport protein